MARSRIDSISQLEGMEIIDNIQLAEYLNAVREIGRRLSVELELRAEEIKGALATIPSASGPSRVRAGLVSKHVTNAAYAAKNMASDAVKTQNAWKKQFEPELTAAKGNRRAKPKFTVKSE